MLKSLTILATAILFAALTAVPCRADWVNHSISGFPQNAIVGGRDNDGNNLYICRGLKAGTFSQQPGWTQAGEAVCHVSYGGGEYQATDFDYWIPSWIPVTSQTAMPPVNAIPFGYKFPPYPALGSLSEYPCLTGSFPGRYAQDVGGCQYTYGGTEYTQWTNGFSVLVDPDGNPASGSNPASYEGAGLLGPFVATAASGGNVPYDAIVSGSEPTGEPLYACSASYQSEQRPGKVRNGLGACVVGYDGSEQFVGNYLVLEPDWTPETGNNFTCQMSGPNCAATTRPIQAGNDTDGEPLYICQGSYNGALYPGKIAASFTGGCSIDYYGTEQYVASYGLLTDGFNYAPVIVR